MTAAPQPTESSEASRETRSRDVENDDPNEVVEVFERSSEPFVRSVDEDWEEPPERSYSLSGLELHPRTGRPKSCVDVSHVTRRLYLGSYHQGALCPFGLKRLGITHVLTVGDALRQPYPDDFGYYLVVIADTPEAEIEKHFSECLGFLDRVFASDPQHRALVHCYAGVSRSASIVIAYLVHSLHMRYPEAFEHVRKARHFILPNKGFRKQLRRYAESQGLEVSEESNRYELAAATLRNMHAKRRIKRHKIVEVARAFEKVFGPLHPHTVDVKAEMRIFAVVGGSSERNASKSKTPAATLEETAVAIAAPT